MVQHDGELPIPQDALADRKGMELARIWAAKGKQYVSIRTGTWDDPAAWGLMLVDLAKHVANAYGEGQAMGADEVLQRIKQGFDAEWDRPTDNPKRA
jgi:hypothetical protein